ncbi:hypothetical protein J3R83DRAFT_12756 [Lanmaoa asiatica]|nr:hypothetical protein J3R83DRAFT_12756 [Lanmaoa asiatica]
MDSPSEVSDVFSLSDHLLAERLQFVKEIGFGNWGSVWLCRPKSSSGKVKDMEVAVKLVHRSKTSTTAARVRSLCVSLRSPFHSTDPRGHVRWNEMKIVRSFKNDPHPSIVPFHSFIITPSYALITMAYLPILVPVEVSESRAKGWFKSLLSGVHFLHSRGVVHNDIKPANILLSRDNIPVLVDFGFAEKYDLTSPKAFHSNLTYGTPEYLSPERARGLPHDTRKSDIWSLGVTFFEILVGRTPFEYEEGEVFEKKEDLEKYWNRTMRGKWVGKYSMSQLVERFLKRMIVPNADLRCTTADLTGDAYWDATPVTPVHGHSKVNHNTARVSCSNALTGKSASAVAPSSAHTRAPSLFDAFRDSFKDKEKEKEPSPSRLLDISLPWSVSRSTPQSSASRPASRTEPVSRSASRMGASSRPASRAESTPKVASGILPASQPRTPESPSESLMSSSRRAITGPISPTTVSFAVRSRTHSRSKSQPKLRTSSGISTTTRPRKLSTVQASPIVKSQRQIGVETEPDEKKDASVRNGKENANARQTRTQISQNSNSSMRRPLGPRQPSPRVTSVSGVMKEPSVPSGQVRVTDKNHSYSHFVHHQTPDHTCTRAPHHLLTPRAISQTPAHTVSRHSPFHTSHAPQQTPVSRHLSGKPPRARGRAGVLVDLTGFARNVDLGAHGVGRPVRHGREKKDGVKENTRGRTTAQKENKENEGLPSQVHASRKDARVSNGLSGVTPFSPKTLVKEQDNSATSISLAANLSGATTVMRGSVRDRMMDWERERERLREMNRLADASVDGHGDNGSTILTRTTTGSDSSDDDDSAVEAEVVAAATFAQAKCKIPVEVEKQKEVNVNVEGGRPTTAQTVTTISSASSNLERSQVEVAKIGVRASAQILSSRNGSITALGLSQSVEKQPSEESQAQNDSVTDIGLPVEVHRNSELGFSSLKHSVKASIDKGVRFYRSSTLAQLTNRPTPVWCASPEPIDFEQRRSGEEGRFSWENIRPEHEVALDRMNLWIQSVERVVEETRQNFASTSVTLPAPLPLASISRSSSQYHGTPNTPTLATQNNNNNSNTLNTSRSSRLPRRLLAANEIFTEPTNPDAPLSPEPSRGEDPSMSFSYIQAPESSVPVLPSISVLMQTPRRRRATISTRSPAQMRTGSATSGIFDGSPSKRREKSKSQSNLDRHIQDIAKLELELNRAPVSSPSPRLSAVLDRRLFVAPPLSPRFTEDSATTPGTTRGRSIQFDDLNSSPYHVEPYPPRQSGEQVVLDSPDRRHLEGVYDRFLMATSGVKRVGKGYQSDNLKPVHDTLSTAEHAKPGHARGFGVFGAGKRAMPPPVSSEDAWRRSTSVDELGFITAGQGTNTSSSRTCRDESKSTFVRRAIKAMVPGKTVSRRLSRTIVI